MLKKISWTNFSVCLDKKQLQAQLKLEVRVWYWTNLLLCCGTKNVISLNGFRQNLFVFLLKWVRAKIEKILR